MVTQIIALLNSLSRLFLVVFEFIKRHKKEAKKKEIENAVDEGSKTKDATKLENILSGRSD